MKKFIAIVICLTALQAFSQDIIKLKTGEELKAKITVVSEDEIQYKEWDYLDGPDFKLSVKKIDYIRFQNGREQKFAESDLMIGAPDPKVLNKKDVVKFSFLSPLFGRTVLGYEHVQRFGLHWEGELGLIGLGRDIIGNNERGFWLAGGPKFIMRKETYMKGERYLHYLHGAYVRPELHAEFFKGERTVSYYSSGQQTVDYSTAAFGLILNLGKQWFLGDAFTLDIYAGVGMASVNTVEDNVNGEDLIYYRYSGRGGRGIYSSDYQGDGEISFAYKGGFKIGFAF